MIIPLVTLMTAQLQPALERSVDGLLDSHSHHPLVRIVTDNYFLFLSRILVCASVSGIKPKMTMALLFVCPLVAIPLT